jgi:hypothetical protein
LQLVNDHAWAQSQASSSITELEFHAGTTQRKAERLISLCYFAVSDDSRAHALRAGIEKLSSPGSHMEVEEYEEIDRAARGAELAYTGLAAILRSILPESFDAAGYECAANTDLRAHYCRFTDTALIEDIHRRQGLRRQ